MRKRVLLIGLLLFTNICLAFSVVYSKHITRNMHVEVSELRKISEELDTEWGRLQLEEGALSSYARVEDIAREKLGMRNPKADEIRLVLDE